MRPILLYIFLITGSVAVAQSSTEGIRIQKTIDDFFLAFHQQDTTFIRTLTQSSVSLQSVVVGNEGQIRVKSEGFGTFLKSIASIPSTTRFKEELHSYKIQHDDRIAQVWTPYSFYVNDSLSHCGVNAFTLYKDESGHWKIVGIVDTRRKDCN